MNAILCIPSVGVALLSSIGTFKKFKNFWCVYNLPLCRKLAENFYKKKRILLLLILIWRKGEYFKIDIAIRHFLLQRELLFQYLKTVAESHEFVFHLFRHIHETGNCSA